MLCMRKQGDAMKNLKKFLYKLTWIKTTTSIQKNQENNTHTNRYTISDIKAAKDMKSRLTHKNVQ